MKGILLFAHGSRDPQWVQPFESVRDAVARRAPGCTVALGYLDHSPPDFITAVDQLITGGVASINVVPLFLGPGAHVREDIPQLMEQATSKHPSVKFELKAFIGDAREVLDAIASYAAIDA